MLDSWNDGPTREAIVAYVEAATTEGGPGYVAPAERVAVFDNDGTLWCEKPMPIELDFILRRLAAQAADDPSFRTRQPWKAAHEGDYAWLGAAIVKHYEGDDADVRTIIGGIQESFGGMTVDDYTVAVTGFMADAAHPRLGRPYHECAYVPMIELLRYLESVGFTAYIASGGDRDFMRPAASPLYGIPPERIIGSTLGLSYVEDEAGGTVVYKPQMEFMDDGPEKPVRIWSRLGRRPAIAGGNANGDIPMLQFAGGPLKPALRLLVAHDDAEREFEYAREAARALDHAAAKGWTVVSMKNDWTRVFAD